MNTKLKLGLLLFFIVFATSANAYSPPLTADKILALVNSDRKTYGLNPVALNPTLNLAASAKAYDMIAFDYFSHISPDGIKPWHWFKSLGYNYVYAGENLAHGFYSADELQQSWMSSETHRANILSPFYSEMGLAIVKTEETTLIVQFFGNKEGKLTQR